MTQVIIKFADDWADEMDLEGFQILDKDKWLILKDKIKAIDHSFELSFGTNEDIEYDNGQDLLNCLTVEDISKQAANAIIKHVGSCFGHCPIDNCPVEN